VNDALDLVHQLMDAERPQNIDLASVTVVEMGPDVGIRRWRDPYFRNRSGVRWWYWAVMSQRGIDV
jgi:hypothetical protein